MTPESAGLVSFGSRRVPGLRRSEVAQLAGVSVEYYTRLERGNLAGVSGSVLHGLASALRLDESERVYLFDLARTAAAPVTPRRPRQAPELRPSIQRLLDAMTGLPAFVRNGRLDVIAVNTMGRALYSHAYADHRGPHPLNLARFVFLDPRAHLLHPNWSESATTSVSIRGPKRGGTRTTGISPILSASCPPAARSSGPSGPPMTCGCTGPAPSTSGTRSSATSSSASTPWSSPARSV